MPAVIMQRNRRHPWVSTWSREDNIQQYVNLLYHSDVVINLASAVTLDAAIFDWPIINAYDLKPASYWFSNARYCESEHYRHVAASGDVGVAHSSEELIEYVKMHLADPTINSAGRQRMVTEQGYQLDGKDCARVVQASFAPVKEAEVEVSAM